MSSPYIFHHIPKAGGTSIRAALSSWFKILNDYRPYCALNSDLYQSYLARCLDVSQYDANYLIVGHFEWDGIHFYERYPYAAQASEKKVFAFIRHPLDLAISLYYHDKQIKNAGENFTLHGHLLRSNNFIAKVLGANYENFMSLIDLYLYIGFVDNMQHSLNVLADLLDKPQLILPTLNVSEKDDQKNTINAQILDAFYKNNALDFKIYEYAKSKFGNY